MDAGQHRRCWPKKIPDIGLVSACTRQQYALPDPQLIKHEALNQCWFDAELDQHWVNVSCLMGVLTGHIVFRTSPGMKILKLL